MILSHRAPPAGQPVAACTRHRHRRLRTGQAVTAVVVTVGLLCLLSGYEQRLLAVSAPALVGRTVLLDPGHGHPDPGASGSGGAEEKDIVLSISLYLRDLLEAAGVRVVMTRETDTDLADPGLSGYSRRKRQDLERRVEMANTLAPDVVVSIHANGFPSPQWYGAQTFYQAHSPESARLAGLVQAQLVSVTGNTTRQASPRLEHCMLTKVTAVSVTVEVGFLSNPREAALLTNARYQKRLAWAIYAGLTRFFSEKSMPATAGIRPGG